MTNNAERGDYTKSVMTLSKAINRIKELEAQQGQMISIIEDLQARVQASGVPDGWKLVPVRPTMEMSRAAYAAWKRIMDMGAIRPNDTMMPFVMFDAMLSAAPTPPKSASVPVERLEALLDNLKSVPVNQEWIYGALAELIAEYKAETTSKGE